MFYNMLLLNYKISQRCPEEKTFYLLFLQQNIRYTPYNYKITTIS